MAESSESGAAPTTDRPPGPDPQGSSQAGAPTPPGPLPTGHPADSSAATPPESGDPDASLVVDDAAGVEEREEQLVAIDEAVEEAEEAIVEDVSELSELGQLAMERDEYLNQLRRLQADFENYKKRVVRQQTEHIERATEELISHLLPALDTFDLALAHGTEGLEPVYRSLLDILEGSGLERVDPLGQPFDPNEHDAVLHEEAEDAAASSPEVVEVLRAGYRWKGRVMRPAMVKVKG